MQIAVVSIFPEMVGQVGEYGVVGRAVERQLLSLQCHNPRDFADDVHRTVDDRPYGGGPGMVLKYEPATKAIHEAKKDLPDGSPVICLSPQGKVFDQDEAKRLAGMQGFIQQIENTLLFIKGIEQLPQATDIGHFLVVHEVGLTGQNIIMGFLFLKHLLGHSDG